MPKGWGEPEREEDEEEEEEEVGRVTGACRRGVSRRRDIDADSGGVASSGSMEDEDDEDAVEGVIDRRATIPVVSASLASSLARMSANSDSCPPNCLHSCGSDASVPSLPPRSLGTHLSRWSHDHPCPIPLPQSSELETPDCPRPTRLSTPGPPHILCCKGRSRGTRLRR